MNPLWIIPIVFFSFMAGFFISAALACAKNADEQAKEAYRNSLNRCGEVEKCDECGTTEKEQAIVDHYDERWCLDCMRNAGHCVVCNAYLPDLVEDYFNYDGDACPTCAVKEEF